MTEFPALIKSPGFSDKFPDDVPAGGLPQFNRVCSLNKAIERHIAFESTSFHMPGHKGRVLSRSNVALGENAWQYDLTELPGLDDLSAPQGVLADLEQRAARLWEAEKSLISVGGASAGLAAVMLWLSTRGRSVLVPRNCHRAIVHGLVLSGLEPIWYEPVWDARWGFFGPVSAVSIGQLLKTVDGKDVAGMVVVSPTYAGAISDIAAIAEQCAAARIPLIVDEAHGAHFIADSGMPSSAIVSGANLVVHSLHKTLSGLTQTGLIHIARGNQEIDGEHIRSCLRSLQTSSPSYLLLASIEHAISLLESKEGLNCIWRLRHFNQLIIDQVAELGSFDVYRTRFGNDPAHIMFGLAEGCADNLYDFFQDRGIFPEAVLGSGMLLLMGVGSEQEDIEKLIAAIKDLHTALEHGLIGCEARDSSFKSVRYSEIEQVMLPRQAFLMPSHMVPAETAIGAIASECIAPCPPGIPICVPGQKITPDLLELHNVRSIRIVAGEPAHPVEAEIILQGSSSPTGSLMEKTHGIIPSR